MTASVASVCLSTISISMSEFVAHPLDEGRCRSRRAGRRLGRDQPRPHHLASPRSWTLQMRRAATVRSIASVARERLPSPRPSPRRTMREKASTDSELVERRVRRSGAGSCWCPDRARHRPGRAVASGCAMGRPIGAMGTPRRPHFSPRAGSWRSGRSNAPAVRASGSPRSCTVAKSWAPQAFRRPARHIVSHEERRGGAGGSQELKLPFVVSTLRMRIGGRFSAATSVQARASRRTGSQGDNAARTDVARMAWSPPSAIAASTTLPGRLRDRARGRAFRRRGPCPPPRRPRPRARVAIDLPCPERRGGPNPRSG